MGNSPYRPPLTRSTSSLTAVNEFSPLLDQEIEMGMSSRQDLADVVCEPLEALCEGQNGDPEYNRLSPWWKAGVSEGSEAGLPETGEPGTGRRKPPGFQSRPSTTVPTRHIASRSTRNVDRTFIYPSSPFLRCDIEETESQQASERDRVTRGSDHKMTLTNLQQLFSERAFHPPRPAFVRNLTNSSTSSEDSSVCEKGLVEEELRQHRRNRRSKCCCACVMITTIVALVLAFYAWSVQMLWDDLNVPSVFRPSLGGRPDNQTGNVTRRFLHSHNDEMHGKDALTLALQLGFGSIEVDTWLGINPASSAVNPRTLEMVNERGNGDTANAPMILMTGHKVKDITDKTLAGLYLDPLFRRLEANNAGRQANETIVGVYTDDPGSEVQLVIDMKSDGDETWFHLVAALQPFLDKGYLSTYDPTASTWKRSALMIVGTGNTPISQVYHQSPRFIFYDAPLLALHEPVSIPSSDNGPATTLEWDSTISPMASSKFPIIYHVALAMPPRNPIVQRLNAYATIAKERGIRSRWWGGAAGPRWVRRRVWELQKIGGADWTNADDRVDAANWLTEYQTRGKTENITLARES